ncbi:MAG: NYN domain-containing protein [Selenomonadaceae bacterium]|nr:NYN domain-containing protein [Selenomonadaceae bacterium]
MTTKKIALFIDADNISAKFGKQVIENLEKRGEIFIRRIYGNWEKNSLHGWNDCILNFSLRAVQQPDYAAGKNATDMSLAIDAMDVLYGGKAEIFALVSNDSDFTPLVIRLREGGMKIIGMGNAHASNSFRLACDEFVDLDAPAEVEIPAEPKKKFHAPQKKSSMQINLFVEDKNIQQKLAPVPASSKVIQINDSKIKQTHSVLHETAKIQQLHKILSEVAALYEENDGFVNLWWACDFIIGNKKIDHEIKALSYDKLRDLIVQFPDLYETVCRNSNKEFFYRFLKFAPKNSVDKFEQIHNIMRETAKAQGDNDGFVKLNCAGNALKENNLTIKGLGHSTLSKFIAAFPNIYEVKGIGATVCYRCK